MYPKKFEKLIQIYERLPGVGNKTATRYAFELLNYSKEELDEYKEAISSISEIKKCKRCGFLSDDDYCEFCKDETRDNTTIMVVAYPQDVIAVEKTEYYKGSYHILNGLISSTKGIYPDDIGIKELLERITPNIKEVIIATSPTIDGEMTALYIDKLLKDKKIRTTRLAHGLPMGSNLDYADELTIIKSLTNRREIEDD